MTNLTEQWKKSELPEGWYYVKDIHNEERLDRYFKETDNFEYLEDWEVDEVLAEVPSYEEYQKLLSDQLAKNEGEEINAELEAENTKLKELLKGAKEIIEWYKADCGYKDTPTEVTLQHINRLLGKE